MELELLDWLLGSLWLDGELADETELELLELWLLKELGDELDDED